MVFRAEDAVAAVGGGDDRPQPASPRRRSGDADPAEHAGRQSAFKSIPGVAAVGRSEQPAFVAAVDQGPGLALDPPGRGVENARVEGVQLQVGGAGVGRDGKNVFPGLAAVGRAVDAPFRIAAEDLAEDGHPQAIRIGWMDADPADRAYALEADVLPGFAGVGRAVHAVTDRNVAPRAGRPGADVDHVRVARRHRHRSYRPSSEVAVGQVLPGAAGVRGPPYAAAGRPHVEGVRVRYMAGNRRYTPSAAGSDEPELESFEEFGFGLTPCRSRTGGGYNEHEGGRWTRDHHEAPSLRPGRPTAVGGC